MREHVAQQRDKGVERTDGWGTCLLAREMSRYITWPQGMAGMSLL